MYLRSLACSGALLVAIAGCPGGPGDGGDDTVNFVVVSDALPASRNVPGLIGARGDVVIATGYISEDGMRSWTAVDPQLGAVVDVLFADDTYAFVRTTAVGFASYQLDTKLVQPLAAPADANPMPAWMYGKLWAVHPGQRTLYLVGATALHRWSGGAWTQKPLPTEVGIYHYALQVQGDGTLLMTSPTGLFASVDAGTTWEQRAPNGAVSLSSIPRVFALAGGNLIQYGDDDRTIHLSADGGRTYTPVMLPDGPSKAADLRIAVDGTLHNVTHRSTDGGRTWTQFFDYAAFGIRFTSGAGGGIGRDRAVIAGNRAYFSFQDADVMRSPVPATRLEFAGSFDLTVQPQTREGLVPMFGASLADGSFLVAGSRSTARYSPDTERWEWLSVRYPTVRLRDGRLARYDPTLVQFSDDEAVTWGPVRPILPDGLPGLPLYQPTTAYPVIQTEDGKLYAASNWKFCTGNNVDCSYFDALSTSSDAGQTWTVVKVGIDIDTPVPLVASGNILYGYAMRSRDGGNSWEPSVALRPLAAHKTGEILFTDQDALGQSTLWLLERDGETTRALGTFSLEGAPTTLDSYDGVTLTLDDEGFGLAECGTPLIQICRSERPLR